MMSITITMLFWSKHFVFSCDLLYPRRLLFLLQKKRITARVGKGGEENFINEEGSIVNRIDSVFPLVSQ